MTRTARLTVCVLLAALTASPALAQSQRSAPMKPFPQPTTTTGQASASASATHHHVRHKSTKKPTRQ